jgi:hypothetical protein
MGQFNSEELRSIAQALKREATLRFGRLWRRTPQQGGPEEAELRQIFIDYNNGELQSGGAREIIRLLNSNMGLAGELELRVYGRELKYTSTSRIGTVRKIASPTNTHFREKTHQQLIALDRIVSLINRNNAPLYLANDDSNLNIFLGQLNSANLPHPELIRTLPQILSLRSPKLRFSNQFDFTHIDCVAKCSMEMWRHGTGVFRLGGGIAIFQNNMAEFLFQPIDRNFDDTPDEVEESRSVLPRIFQRSQNNAGQPSEAILEGLAMLGGVLHWIHDANESGQIIALGSHRTNESFNAMIGSDNPIMVNDLQIETDITTQVESDDSDVGVHEVKCEIHSEMRNDFARYQLFNPSTKVRNRYQGAGDSISNLRISFLVGHWRQGDPGLGVVMDAYVYEFTDICDISTMRVLRRRRFEFTPY